MSQRFNTIIYFVVFIIFLYIFHGVITPFLLGALLAFLLTPLVRLAQNKLQISKTFATVIIYVLTILLLFFLTLQITFLLSEETKELNSELAFLNKIPLGTFSNLPGWVVQAIDNFLSALNVSTLIAPNRIVPFFRGAISSVESLLIFLISGFYFLKDGETFIRLLSEKILKPKNKWLAMKEKITSVFYGYLRGQIYLIFLVSIVFWITLSLLRVKYSLLLAIFTGLAEIVPIIGPVVAAVVTILVAMFDGINILSFSPPFEGIFIALIYFFFRQIEDIFVIPYIYSKTVKLHPLVVIFAILMGAQIWGIIGMILAVPVASLIKVMTEDSWEM